MVSNIHDRMDTVQNMYIFHYFKFKKKKKKTKKKQIDIYTGILQI